MTSPHDPWEVYYREFAGRTQRIPADAFERSALLYEAAHDAYQKATDLLTAEGWDAERALMAGRLFSSVTKGWVDNGAADLGSLETELRAQFDDWSPGNASDNVL